MAWLVGGRQGPAHKRRRDPEPLPDAVRGSHAPRATQRMAKKLAGARFRRINEELYTTTSAEALRAMRDDPSKYEAYHAGFREQVRKWPRNPLQDIIAAVRKMPRSAVVGDFGCGDAELARSVEQRVHSFDLVAATDAVVACDMAHTPLGDKSLDVAVFCLALMGSNWTDFVREAHRVLRPGGMLKVVEVRSRIPDVDDFARTLASLGFDEARRDAAGNTHFIAFDCTRAQRIPSADLVAPPLRPCVYKKR